MINSADSDVSLWTGVPPVSCFQDTSGLTADKRKLLLRENQITSSPLFLVFREQG